VAASAVRVRGAGELLGELAALDHIGRTASAIALDDLEAGVISAVALRRFLAERPTAALAFAVMLAGRLREGRPGARRALVARQPRSRRAAAPGAGRALRATRRGGRSHRAAADAGRAGGWIGASLESVARALRMMRSLGWVATSRRAITVLDVEALRARRAMPAAV